MYNQILYGQSRKGFKYSINSKLKEQIDTSFAENNAAGYAELKIFVNDSLYTDTYNKNKMIDFYYPPRNINNTLTFILNGPDLFSTIVLINEDSCSLELIALDGLVESYKEIDGIIEVGNVQCDKQSITFVSKPIIKEGKLVEGVIELTSEDYVDFRDDKLRKRKSQMRVYFRIEIPKLTEN